MAFRIMSRTSTIILFFSATEEINSQPNVAVLRADVLANDHYRILDSCTLTLEGSLAPRSGLTSSASGKGPGKIFSLMRQLISLAFSKCTRSRSRLLHNSVPRARSST
jgi:hypothetical protein